MKTLLSVCAVDSKYWQEYSAAHGASGVEGEGKEVCGVAGVCANWGIDIG